MHVHTESKFEQATCKGHLEDNEGHWVLNAIEELLLILCMTMIIMIM